MLEACNKYLPQPVCDSPDDHVLSCVFYEGVQNEWLERELVLTGHSRGVVNIWSKVIRNGGFELELIRQLHHTDNNRDNGANIQAGISCILALPQVVYTGDEAGRVVRIFPVSARSCLKRIADKVSVV